MVLGRLGPPRVWWEGLAWLTVVRSLWIGDRIVLQHGSVALSFIILFYTSLSDTSSEPCQNFKIAGTPPSATLLVIEGGPS